MRADTIFVNGSVITVNKNDDIVQAVAVGGNKILAVGTNEEIEAYRGEDTKVIDLEGRTLSPGFIDSHIHYVMNGMKQGPIIDVDFVKVKSIAEIKELIAEAAKNKKPGEWIVLNGYDHNKLLEGRHPTKEDFDEVAPNNPVQCTRCCAHMGVYNTLALEVGGITSPDQYPPGEIEVNEDGSLHGLLRETAHMEMSAKVVFPREDILQGLIEGDKIGLSVGVTSITDAGSYRGPATSVIQEACNTGKIKTRVRMMIFDMFGKKSGTSYIREFISTGIHTGCGDEHFKIGPTKIMLDGSSSGPSAALLQEYSHEPGYYGLQVWQQEEADEIVLEAHKAGFQVTAHAVGDKAVEIMVNAVENAQKIYPREDCRHRIEHCGIVNEELLDRIKALGIVPISNPGFIDLNGKDYERFYGDRVEYMFPLKRYLERGIITAIGTDTPIILPNPMHSIAGAVTRQDKFTGKECGGSQKIGMMDAIRMYTYNGAYVNFEEDIKGSIEPGKLADLIVLSEDILKVADDKIKSVEVDMTFIDGEMVFQR